MLLITLIAAGGATLSATVLGPKKLKKAPKVLKAKARFSRLRRRSDQALQTFFQTCVDPKFTSKERAGQLAEFAPQRSAEEKALNRRIALSAGTIAVSGAGAVLGAPALTALAAAGVLVTLAPVTVDSVRALWRERKVTYRGFSVLGMAAAMAGGYIVISSVMMLTVLMALKLSARAEAAAQAGLRHAFDSQRPAAVWTIIDGVEVETPFEDLRVGDVVAVEAGQTIPVDGVICGGEGVVDQQILTGEEAPVEKVVGDQVFANTVALSGRLHVRVERAGDETAAAKIAEILTNAAHNHLETTARSERLADRMTLPMLGASAAAFALVGPAGGLTLLNSGYGSKMIIAGPLTALSYLDQASREGALVKNGRALETMASVDAVVFDKTGTLTTDTPMVAEVLVADSANDPDAILRWAAAAERRQTHPIARAVLAAAAERGLQVDPPEEAAYALGMGLSVRFEGRDVLVGSGRFLERRGVTLPPCAEDWRARCEAAGGSLVFIGVDGRCVGALRLEAQLRPGAAKVVADLIARDVSVYILSGDYAAPTETLARRLGVSGCFAEVMPQDKAATIRALQDDGRTVCFVGDGLNDALALQQADVSVSMRGATTLATDSADIVLLGASLAPIPRLFEISAAMRRNLERTLRICYIPTGVLTGGVFLLGFGLPMAAALYGVGLTSAVANATLLSRSPKNRGALEPPREAA